MTLGNDNGTDGQTERRTDRRTDRVRRNMRPPPREEGRIIMTLASTPYGSRHKIDGTGVKQWKQRRSGIGLASDDDDVLSC